VAYLDDLKTTRDNLAARMADITGSHFPTVSINGKSVSKAEYLKTLSDEFKAINELIIMIDPSEDQVIGWAG